ncbi:methionyl-tRNA formyltransferase [Corynebacterium glucuronolyticum]|uniref:methionyl-tRNA formyltransferase n=1 Tax=Corynebacterium glucuronolyticum TaxID=39791 RepID=UPI00191E1609|nr:methionyl-tRNA formyltransferase [Corynebacterium glucuronolyticum]QQU89527.1 methionyl-tRNA formyltransferase [Corynebacterium glucuronolyticum]
MRILFAGTPEPAVATLERLIASDHEVIGVVTRPDARRGRGRTLHPSPVAECADKQGLPVYKPETLRGNKSFVTLLKELSPDCVPVIAYGNLIPEELLGIPEHGFVNVHYSLLPRWRGAAPVQAAIAAGDDQTGATIFRIDAGLDTGPVLSTVTTAITADDTADDLLTRLAYEGADLLVQTLTDLEQGAVVPVPQEGEATYAHKLDKDTARIDWEESADVIDRRIRAFTPAPGAWTQWDGAKVKLGPVSPLPCTQAPASSLPPSSQVSLSPGEVRIEKHNVFVGTGSVAVALSTVQAPGKKMMDAPSWGRGVQQQDGIVWK